MNRRDFLATSSATLGALTLPKLGFAAEPKPLSPKSAVGPWRTVEATTRIKMSSDHPGKAWLPVPLTGTTYQEHVDTLWEGNFTRAGLLKDDKFGARFFYAEWAKAGEVELATTFKVRVRDRAAVEKAPAADSALYLEPSRHVAIDGSVKDTAAKIVGHVRDHDQAARKIYDWMVENTERDASVRGCGLGDVKATLSAGRIRGKCADLSSLYVGLCRASGIPAREVFGMRVLPSNLSKSIGKADDVTGGQHCRAEYYSKNYGGWVPVDPADVRKVVLEEKLSLDDSKVESLRRKLFGFWEMNWIAFNSARDFLLPPSPGVPVNYMMYPYYVSEAGIKDGMDPKDLPYSIHAREV